jgi:hypothetical protein
MRKDDTLDKNHSLFFLGLNANAIVDKEKTVPGDGVGRTKALFGLEPDASFLGMPYVPRIEKSGQV